MTGRTSGLLLETPSTLSILRLGRSCARSLLLRTQERPLTVSTYISSKDRIQKIDPQTGGVLATIPAPPGGCNSGLTWAEGTLWIGQYEDRKIHQLDPQTGAILRTIESHRFVTGVTWIEGELWHGTWEEDESDLRRVDPRTGELLERLQMPPGMGVSGLESDGGNLFFCGGGSSGKLRVVRRPTRASAKGDDTEVPVGSTSK